MRIYICFYNKETQISEYFRLSPFIMEKHQANKVDNLLALYFSFGDVEFINICEKYKKII